VVACNAKVDERGSSPPLESEVSLDGVEIGDDDAKTLIMDAPVPAHHFLGIDIELRDPVGSSRKCVLSQHNYALHVLKYFQSISPGLALRKIQTPCNDSVAVLGVAEGMDQPGKYASKAARLVGLLLYLMRGTRSDLAVALSILGSFVTRWSTLCDDTMIRVMSYLMTYPNVVLELTGDSRDMLELVSECFCDSDHGGDKETSRSISGAFSFIMGRHGTKALMAWFAVKMRSSGVSTGEVEVGAASVSLRRLALPLASVLEFVFVPVQAKVLTKLRGDAEVAEHVFASGRSKSMRYIRKVHRISIHFVYDALHLPDVSYEHVDSNVNCSDMLTKPLPKETHFRHLQFVGLVVLSEDGKVLAMVASKGNRGLKQGSRRVWVSPDMPHSLEHMLLHLPMHPDCEVCQLAKISITPARRAPSSERETMYGGRFYVDLIGPMPPDLASNKYMLVARDEATSFACVNPIPDKSGSTVTEAYKAVTSGSTIHKVRPDWGKEFQGRFEAHCKRAGTEVERGLPRRSTTFARAERWHRTLEEGVRADLIQSGLGHQWYSLSAVMWTEHWNRLSRDGRPSPYVLRHHRESGLELRPFGSLIIFLKDKPSAIVNLPKFEPRGDFGIVVGYGAHSSFIILQLAPFIQEGRRLFKRTRDVKFPADGPKFPIRFLLKAKEPEVAWHFLTPCEQESDDSAVSAPKSSDEIQCVTCLGFIAESLITCPACVLGFSKRLSKKTSDACMHVDSSACRHRRCSCTAESVGSFAVEQCIDPLPPVDDEPLSLADIAFGSLIVPDNIAHIASDVGADFEEPDINLAARESGISHAAGALASHDFGTTAVEAVKSFCMVYKSVSLKSASAQTPEATAAIAKEVKTMEDLNVWDGYDTVMELWELHALHHDALVVYAHLLLGCKDMESSSASELDPHQAFLLKWKARIVAGGNRLLDINGQHFREKGLHGAPTSLEAIRLVCWWATMNPTHILLQADVTGAYLQSRLGGRPVWVVLPPSLWPQSWRNKGYKQPVLRLRKALYGLQRSGFDWAKRAHSVLSSLGWTVIPDVVDAVYIKRDGKQVCILALYVDDILASGPSDMLVSSLNAIRGA